MLTIIGFEKCFEDFAQDFHDIGLKYSYFEGIIRTKVDYMNVFDVVLLCLPSLVEY